MYTTQASAVLVLDPLADGASSMAVPVISMIDDWPAIESFSGTPLDIKVDVDNAAFVLYTSGSTGKPKAALLSHKALMNRFVTSGPC